jgi:serine/threonine-protein kinase
MVVARLKYAPRPPREYRSDLPMPVEDVIMRALARKPEARYPTASALVAALKSAAGLAARPLTTAAPPISPPQGLPQPIKPVSQPAGIAPTQALPPTPPYVISPATQAADARTATPIGGVPASGPTVVAAPPAPTPRARRGLLIGGIVLLLLVLALAGGAFVLLNRGPDPRIAQGLQDGRAALEQKGGFERAIGAFDQVLAADPQNAQAQTWLALIHNLRGEYNAAEQAARAAIAADPKVANSHAMLAEALAGRSDYEAALSAVDSAIASDDQAPAGYGVRAAINADRAVLENDEDLLDQAADDADKAIELAEQHDNLVRALAHRARGYVYWQEYSLKDDADAVKRGVEEFNKAIGLQGQIAEFHSDLGYFYDAQGEHERAKEKFEAALDLDPSYGHTHAGLGWNLYYLDDYQGALNEFEQAIKLAPEDTDAYNGKSRVYQEQSPPKYDEAIAALEHAAETAPKSAVVWSNLGWAYRNKAQALDYGGDEQKQTYDQAEQQFRKALELNNKYYDALTGLGWVLQDQADLLSDHERFQEAVATLEQSIDIRDEQANAHSALGWSYYGLQQYDEAADAFERAIELNTQYADAFYGLGRAYEGQGKRDEARQAYQSAIDNGSTSARTALDQLK